MRGNARNRVYPSCRRVIFAGPDLSSCATKYVYRVKAKAPRLRLNHYDDIEAWSAIYLILRRIIRYPIFRVFRVRMYTLTPSLTRNSSATRAWLLPSDRGTKYSSEYRKNWGNISSTTPKSSIWAGDRWSINTYSKKKKKKKRANTKKM